MLARIVDGVIHRVERGDTLNFGVASLEAVSYFGDGVAVQEPAILTLSDPEPGQDTRFLIRIVSFESV
jgi:hypothetical protein